MNRSQSIIGLLVLVSIGCPQGAMAQISADGTVGTIVTTAGNIFTITGGTRPSNGPNLFHSFSQFSLLTGRSAIFQNDPTVQTIFSRVTGGSRSDIDGLIRANGNASLFLMNPNGIVFGPNGRLQLGGSFVGTTANSLKFSNGVEFSTVNPVVNPLLTLNLPIGLQMGSNPGAITNRSQAFGVGLQVPIGKTLALVGGNIALPGGALRVRDGHIALGSVGANQTVAIVPSPSGWTFNYSGVNNFQDIQLTNRALVDTSGNAGGSIQIQGRRLSLSESRIKSYTSGPGNGGDLRVSASEALSIRNGFIGTTVLATGSGRGGNVQITSPNIVLDKPSGLFSEVYGTGIFSDTYGSGAAGNLTIDSQSIELLGDPNDIYFSYLSTDTYSSGRGGNLTITGPHIVLRGGLSSITSDTWGSGAGGNLTIDSKKVELLGDSDGKYRTYLSAGTYSYGQAGNLTITSPHIVLTGRRTEITSKTSGSGTGGNLTIDADQLILNKGGSIDSSTVVGSGNAGNLTIDTDQLILDNGSAINSNTVSGSGNAGNLTIDTNQLILDNGSAINSSTLFGSGNAGNMDLQIRTLQVLNGSSVNKLSYGSGNVGHLNIAAKEFIKVIGNNLNGATVIRSQTFVDGKGGDITVKTPDLLIDNGAKILMATHRTADAGTVTVTTDRLRLDNSGGSNVGGHIVSSTFGGTGNAGRVNVTTRTLQMFNGSYMATDTFGPGNAGYLNIQATESIEMSGASPTNYRTALFSGNGNLIPSSGNSGTIWVETPSLIMRDQSYMRAVLVGSGAAGNIIIKADTIDAQNSSLFVENGQGLTSQVGQLDITANQVRLDKSAITTQTYGQGEANPITINVQNLQLLNESSITASTSNQGNANNIDISATTLVVQNSNITSSSGESASGNAGAVNLTVRDRITLDRGTLSTRTVNGSGGRIIVNTDQLQLANNSLINSSSTGKGDAGRIDLNIAQQFTANNGTLSTRNRDGAGGNIQLTAQQVQLQNNSLIDSSTTGQGNAGTVTINAPEVSLDGETQVSTASTGSGNAGNISLLQTNNLALTSGAQITSSSDATGNAGRIDLNIAQQFTANNGTLSTRNRDGAGGNIQLTAQQVQLQNNSLIDSSTTGQGNAGAVVVNAGAIALDQSTISSQSTGSGNSGILNLITGSLALTENALLSTAASNTGKAGNVVVQATDDVTLENGSQITSRSTGTGLGGTVDIAARSLFLNQNVQINASTVSSDGGNLRLTLAETLVMRDRSLLNAEAGGTGDGGNILLNAPFIIGLGNSDIIANAFQGRGGTIKISTDGIFGLKFRNQLTPENDITVSSEFGVNGTVQVDNFGVDPNSGLISLPVDIIEPSQQIANGCNPNQGSSFIVTGRDGIPNHSIIPRTWQDRRGIKTATNLQTVLGERSSNSPKIVYPPIEATNWQRNANSSIDLFAGNPSSMMQSTRVTCADVGKS